MPSKAFSSRGVVLQRGNGATPEVFTAIGEIRSFDGPNGSAKVIDVTTLDSTGIEKLIGLPNEGQISLNMNFDPNNTMHVALIQDRKAGAKTNFKIIYPVIPAYTQAFSAFVLEFSTSGGVDQQVEAKVTLEITGSIN